MEEWGAVYNTTTEEFGLHPCNTSGNYSDTGLSPARYLVRLFICTTGDLTFPAHQAFLSSMTLQLTLALTHTERLAEGWELVATEEGKGEEVR